MCLALIAGGCNGRPEGNDPAAVKVADERASSDKGGGGVRLALLEPSDDMFLAALEGILQAEGRCLYIVGRDKKRSRTLPAFHIAGIGWDSGARTLKVNGRVFAQGDRVLLTGGRPPTTAGFRWVQRPDPSCDASDIFVTGAIEPAKGRPR